MQLQQQLLREEEKIFPDEQMQLRKQQTIDTKLLCETVLFKTTEERGSRILIANSVFL